MEGVLEDPTQLQLVGGEVDFVFPREGRRKEEGRRSNPHLAFSRRNDPTGQIFGDCLVGVWRVYGNCLKGVWWASGGCLAGVLWLSGGCLKGVWKVSYGCLAGICGMFQWYSVKSGLVKSG